MSLYIDLSEFLRFPIRTGIQRISGEMCRYLPPGFATPIRARSGRFVSLPRELIQVIGSYFGDAKGSALAEIQRLSAMESNSAVDITNRDIVFVGEVWDVAERFAAYRALSQEQLNRCRFLIYDLLPLTHPEYFDPGWLLHGYSYFQLIRDVPNCAFISEYTRETYYRRLKRTEVGAGVVLPLGSDSMGPRTEKPILDRPLTFTVLGTIEPRKNHELILRAFQPLLKQVDGLTLNFIGLMGWIDRSISTEIATLASDPKSGLRFFATPDDGSIRRHIEQSRATIYVSAAEGYGLPPVESLWVGTPVIASTNIPSLQLLGANGIHYVGPLSISNLREAIIAFLDNDYSRRKIQETSSVPLPTWKSFAEAALGWCSN